MKKILFSILLLAGITATAQVKVGSNPTTIDTGTTNFQVEGTTTADQFVVLKNGNVGIGTTTPAAKLDVAGQVKISGGAPGAGKVLTSDADGLASWQTAASGADGDAWGVTGEDVASNISRTGRVGIGIAAPLANLHVKTSVIIENTTTNSGFIEFFRQGEAARDGYIGFGSDANGGIDLFSDISAKPLKLGTNNGHLLIGTGTGNVGIGTTTPAAKLDVNGQVKISGGAPGAGKVLTSDAAGLASWQTVSVATVNVDNTTAPVAATVQQAVTSGSIQFTTTNTGVIMKSADGTNYMLTIENGGVLTVKKVTP